MKVLIQQKRDPCIEQYPFRCVVGLGFVCCYNCTTRVAIIPSNAKKTSPEYHISYHVETDQLEIHVEFLAALAVLGREYPALHFRGVNQPQHYYWCCCCEPCLFESDSFFSWLRLASFVIGVPLQCAIHFYHTRNAI